MYKAPEREGYILLKGSGNHIFTDHEGYARTDMLHHWIRTLLEIVIAKGNTIKCSNNEEYEFHYSAYATIPVHTIWAANRKNVKQNFTFNLLPALEFAAKDFPWDGEQKLILIGMLYLTPKSL